MEQILQRKGFPLPPDQKGIGLNIFGAEPGVGRQGRRFLTQGAENRRHWDRFIERPVAD